ncbi:MAG: AAA family ATPase [Thermoprotei archaeon]
MIIESIHLENIRSHTFTTANFDEGVTLIEGDVGSGKSSVLKAIQFALFGVGDPRSLLRYGENEGKVVLNFKIGDRQCAVHRELRRTGDKVRTAKGYWEENGNLLPLSASQLNEKVMEALGIRASERARRLPIWEYAFYTSQEKLKAILSDKEIRTNAVGAAFNTEKYRRAITNSQKLYAYLFGEAQKFESYSIDLSEKEAKMNELQGELEKLIPKINGVEAQAASAMKEKEQAWTEYKTQSSRLSAMDSSISDLKRQEENLEKRIQESKTRLSSKLSERDKYSSKLKDIETELSKPIPSYKLPSDIEVEINSLALQIEAENAKMIHVQDAKKNCEDLKRDLQELSVAEHRSSSVVETELNDYVGRLSMSMTRKKQLTELLSTYDDMEKQGKCPCCGRQASAELVRGLREKPANELSQLEVEIPALSKKVTQLRAEFKKSSELDEQQKTYSQRLHEFEGALKALTQLLSEEIQEVQGNPLTLADELVGMIKQRIEFMRASQSNLRQELKLSVEAQAKARAREQLISRKADLESALGEIEREISELNEQIEREGAELREYQSRLDLLLKQREGIYNEYKVAEGRYSESNEKYTNVNSLYQSLITQKNSFEQELAYVSREVEDKRKARESSKVIASVGNWIKDEFIPLLRVIEQEVLAKLNQEFEDRFSSFFSTLISDSQKKVMIDEEFSPIIEHGGIDMDVEEGPSGGERSSIALAYRLALNEVSREVAGLSIDLVILDEPTDGFSSEQLSKFRDLINALDAKQVILVSHEKELESAADRVLLVTKDGDASKVQLV